VVGFWILSFGLCSGPSPAGLRPVDQAGYRKLIDNHRGAILLVDFWATWCEPCRQEMPGLVKLAKKYGQRGFRLVTISADDEEQLARAEEFLRSQGAPLPAYYKKAADDTAFINAVDPSWSGALPGLFLYGPDGRLAAKFVGETDFEALEAAVEKQVRSQKSGVRKQ
jgi:thiol-disulfide isomerase/thioredoxin